MSVFYTILRIIAKPFLSLIYPTKVIHKERMIEDKCIICCNHLASLDVILVGTKLLKKECNVVGKAELFKSKIKGWFLKKIGAIPIERGESDISAIKKILKVLKEDRQLLIFPEGTRNTTGTTDLQELKHGTTMFAMKTDAPIIPLIIYEKARAFHRNYLIVGEPINLKEKFPVDNKESREASTNYLFEKMSELQKELRDYVQNKKKQ